MSVDGEPGGAEPSSTGGRLADYEILEPLGFGGMGVVQRARHRITGQFVALKLLPAELALDATLLARWRREVRGLARCSHPNVVRLVDSGLEDGRPWHAMELVDGPDLDRLGRLVRLTGSVQDALRQPETSPAPTMDATRPDVRAVSHAAVARHFAGLVRDAARGLHALHEMGIVHRDVKPANILVSRADGRARVTDLGVADDLDASRSLTGDRLVGTLRYMSPEQVRHADVPVDRRADVYALGVTLHELVTGRPFFEAAGTPALLDAILNEDPPDARAIAPNVPADLARILAKATSKDRNRRYSTAGALADDLDAFLEGRAIAARPPTLAYIVGLAVRRHRVAVAAAGSLVLAGVIALSAFAWMQQRNLELERGLRRDLEKARVEADRGQAEARGQALARAAQEALRRGEVTLALNLSLEATRLTRDPAAAQAVRDAVQAPWHEMGVMRGHLGPVTSVRLSPDGRLLATASRDGSIRTWSTDGRLVSTQGDHAGPVQSVRWSADGSRLLTCGDDGTAKIRDGAGAVLRTFDHEGDNVLACEWVPGDESIVTGTLAGRVMLWSVASDTSRVLCRHDGGERSRRLALSPDGRRLLSCGTDGTVRLVPLDGGASTALDGFGGFPWDAHFFPDSSAFVAAGFAREPIVASRDGRVLTRLHGHVDAEVQALAISADGTRIATGGIDLTVRTWQRDGSPIDVLRGLEAGPHVLAFSPDGTLLLAACRDGSVRIWDRHGRLTATLRHDDAIDGVGLAPVLDACWSRDGMLIATGSADGSVRAWSRTPATPVTVDGGSPGAGLSIARDDSLVAALFENGSLALLGPQGDLRRALRDPASDARVAGLAPDGSLLLVGHESGIVERLDTRDGERRVLGHPLDGAVRLIAWRGDGEKAAVASEGRMVRVYRSDGSLEREELLGTRPNGLAFDAEGRVIVLQIDRKLQALEPEGGLKLLADLPSTVSRLALSPDGRRAAVGGRSSWFVDLATGETTEIDGGAKGEIASAIAWSPDGSLFAIGWGNGSARLFRADGASAAMLRGHVGSLTSIAFAPDGKLIATASGDGTVRLWTPDGQPRATLTGHGRWIPNVAFARDGERLFSIGEDGTVRLWIVGDETLRAAALSLLRRPLSASERERHAALLPPAGWEPSSP